MKELDPLTMSGRFRLEVICEMVFGASSRKSDRVNSVCLVLFARHNRFDWDEGCSCQFNYYPRIKLSFV